MEVSGENYNLELEDGTILEGTSFGAPKSVAGEVVFNTGMVGYPETLTDPSYRGQILVLTYPLIGNYGVPNNHKTIELEHEFESDRIQISGLIVSEVSENYSHWNSAMSLPQWLKEQGIPALSGIDTRALTKRLRQKGTMLGKIEMPKDNLAFCDPNKKNLVSEVSVTKPVIYEGGEKRVVLIDCGCKLSIIRSLLARDITITRVPYNYDFNYEDFDGLVISNGPGDPKMCEETIEHVKKCMDRKVPILGICLGNQILALAAGANTYKLKFGHRSQNQPSIEVGTKRCYITSQNHGYAVDEKTIPKDWKPWFVNANDETNEGIRHEFKPFISTQFHPEAAPGPVDTDFIFGKFIRMLT
jgi:carbamoyl-phosphate synthase small subunit